MDISMVGAARCAVTDCGVTLMRYNKHGYCLDHRQLAPAIQVQNREKHARWRAKAKHDPVQMAKWRAAQERCRRRKLSTPEGLTRSLIANANNRARRKGLPYGLSLNDLLPLPTVCPVLGLSLDYSGIRPDRLPCLYNAASLDRIVPERGYVRGNVRVISARANTLKRDGTAQELLAVAMDAIQRKENTQ